MLKKTSLVNKFSFRIVLLILLLLSYKVNNSRSLRLNNCNNTEIFNPDNLGFLNKHKASLKILTWNIYMLPYINMLNNNSTRAEMIGEVISHFDYDIIIFEEAFYSHSRKMIKQELQSFYPYIYGPANSEDNYFETNSGVWILSKVPLKLVKSIRYKNHKSFDAIARKGAMLLEGIVNGKTYQLVGTHLQAEEYCDIRKLQMEQLTKELLDPLKIKGVPQIICGDFNVDAKDFNEYSFMINKLNVSNDSLFSLQNKSFDEVKNKLAHTKKPDPKTLDYILIRNEEKGIGIKRFLKIFKGHDNDGNLIDLSDHYGVEATIVF